MAKPSVLVVDDEESMRYFLTRALKKKGYEATAVSTGEEALAALVARSREIVLLDLMLPGVDGIEVLAEIKRTAPDTVVVLMTGYGTVERALQAMRRGAADFITKPFTGPDVIAKIEEAISKVRAARPLAQETELPASAASASGVDTPPTAAQMPPPRPLTAYLLEAAEAHDIAPGGIEGGDLPYREAERLFETLYFSELIRRTGGNVSMAARIAGISRPSMHRKIHELGIEVDRFRG